MTDEFIPSLLQFPRIAETIGKHIQFARLICEYLAVTDENDNFRLAKSMDISLAELKEWQEHAKVVCERDKQGRMPPGLEEYWVCGNAGCKTELGPKPGACPTCGYTTASYKLENMRWR